MFSAARGRDTWSADDYAGDTVGSYAKLCQGQFTSGKQSIPSVDGSVVRKVLTTCRTGDITGVTETTIIRHANGFLLELTHVFRADDTAQIGKDRGAMVDAAADTGYAMNPKIAKTSRTKGVAGAGRVLAGARTIWRFSASFAKLARQ
jgi:hypothetical protein